MIVFTKSCDHVLPKGDRYDLPPGRRQFSLASLMWLLGYTSATAAFCRWLGVDLAIFVVAIAMAICIWWRVAEKRQYDQQQEMADQTELREEIRQWLRYRGLMK